MNFSNLLFSILLASTMSATYSYAKNLTTTEKLADFQQLNLIIESSYAPLKYKEQTQNILVNELKNTYAQKIEKTQTNFEFYQEMIKYVSEYHDGHFGVTVPSDYRSDIAINTDLVNGKALIGDIDRAKLSETDFPFAKGDEVISIDQQPVLNIIADLSLRLGSGYSLSEQRTAAQILFSRSGRRFFVPTGIAEIQIRRGTSNIIETVKLPWKVSGESFDEKKWGRLSPLMKKQNATSYDMLSIREDVTQLLGHEKMERSYRCSGDTRIAIPAGATILFKKPFVAYYHSTPKGNIGYLRIPHYSWDDVKIDGITYTPDSVFKIYEFAIQQLEKNTVGLIIDQDHNCGGSVGFLENMASLFMTEPFTPLQFELLATKKEYFRFKSWMTGALENTIEYQNMKSVLDLIKATWEAGQTLTTKISIFGNDKIAPNHIHYTKPIVMLIDELSGSGGDAFPALLGGFGRVTLLGTRTSGLGGHIEEPEPLSFSGLNLRITKSLFYRPDGVAVENNGAVPHVPYSITRDDYIYEYKDYQKFYLMTLLNLIK